MLGAGLRASVPLLLAALGETFAERAGLLNLGIEGMMLAGAFGGFFVALNTGTLPGGLAAGLLLGMVLALVFGVLTITLRVNQIIVGLGMTLFAAGLTSFLFRHLYGVQFPTLPQSLEAVAIPVLVRIPVIGTALFEQKGMVYVALALVVVLGVVLRRTTFGLAVRATGEDPFAADAAGVDVFRVRYLAMAIGGAMAGLGGAFLSVGDLNFFVPGMTRGLGFIAIAITMLGRWDPYRVLVGALIFGLMQSLSDGLQILGVSIRPEFLLMLPYLGVILALVILAQHTPLPAALGLPYQRGQK